MIGHKGGPDGDEPDPSEAVTNETNYSHLPVMPAEVAALMEPERGSLFIDATVGLGGHSAFLREKADLRQTRWIGLDQDSQALVEAKQRLGDGVELVKGNFADLAKIAARMGITAADGILMDLGVSSLQLDDSERGFAFRLEAPLDMRMDQENTVTAASIVNTWPEAKLADLFYNLGGETLSRRIAKAIVDGRRKKPWQSTIELADLIYSQYPGALRHRRVHPATKVFQALRMEVNQEIASLHQGIAAALALLRSPGGRLVIITFHSLEDRIVKQAFKAAVEAENYRLLTKKPIQPSRAEVLANRRSRSAKVRGIVRL